MLADLDPDAFADLRTPCLIVDLAAVDRNIARAEQIAGAAGLRLRPHFKAHKCSRLMQRQLASGVAVGATCQTVREAVVLAEAGVPDILVANQVVTRPDLAAIPALTEQTRLSVAVDHPEHVVRLASIAGRCRADLGVLIEVDVGSKRCGVQAEGPELIRLAELIDEAPHLRLDGILGYEGHAVLREDRFVRTELLEDVRGVLSRATRRLLAAGFAADFTTGGGTGTLELVAELGSHHEAQPGSYVLMDATYQRLRLDFEPALYCLTTVISRPTADRAVTDAGLKALSVEYGMPVPADPALSVTRLADEHALVEVGPGADPVIGQPILFQPAHLDPTVNLHSALQVWDGLRWEAWSTDGRYL